MKALITDHISKIGISILKKGDFETTGNFRRLI